MLKFTASLTLITAVLWPLTALAIVPVTQVHESPASDIFAEAKATGTFVLYDPWDNKLIFHNEERAKTRFVPASTFKIPHTLLALHFGVINNVDEFFYHWDGTPQDIQTWEKDMNLRNAMKTSCVPAYRQIANVIGLEKMRAAIKDLNYGNTEIDSQDNFWLDGSLQISALEQAVFMVFHNTNNAETYDPNAPPYRGTSLVFKQEHIDALNDITLYAQNGAKYLHAKTGTSTEAHKKAVCWWVGWIKDAETGRVWGFALNIDMPDYPNGPDRIELGLKCLKALGVWE